MHQSVDEVVSTDVEHLATLPSEPYPGPDMDQPTTNAQAWAASGALALTGRADHDPLVPPDALIDRIRLLAEPLGVDPLPFLADRAAARGLSRHGDVSCGGTAHLLRSRDGWIAVNLPRDDDHSLVPAWLGIDPNIGDLWPQIEEAVSTRTGDDLVAVATLLGLPAARLGESAAAAPHEELAGLPVGAQRFGRDHREPRPPVVVDLSALWAGPLCSRLLADRGARVIKVESTARPDGARRGPSSIYDALNAGKESVSIDLRTPAGVAVLRALVERADVVIEASRPRALAQLGLDVHDVLAWGSGPRVWISITGHGRAVDRVAFGDDAAVAGGLVALDGAGPCFVADAVADPLAGFLTASAAVTALATPGRWLIDVSMAGAASFVAGDPPHSKWTADPRLDGVEGRALPSSVGAARLGRDTTAVLAEFGIPGGGHGHAPPAQVSTAPA